MTADELASEYRRSLREYVAEGTEAALTRAYELGRAAAGAGLGVLDVGMVHHEALLDLDPTGAGGASAVTMAAQFFAESLSPFEMTLRSYRANARLLGLGETLAERNSEIDRAREQLRTILDATTAVIYLKDAEGRYLFVNQRFADCFGVTSDDVLGKVDADVLPPDVAATLHRDDLEVLATRAPHELEEVLPTHDGARTYLSLKFPLVDAARSPYAICCVATDITERKRADEALQKAREAAERQRTLEHAVQARDQFLAIAAHELRTPITSLNIQIENFRRAVGTKAKAGAAASTEAIQTKVEGVARQVVRLTHLVNTLLSVAKITSGPLHLSRERLDLGDLVAAVVARMAEAIRGSRSEVSIETTGPVVGEWDRQALDTVIANLLSNAVKFGEGKPIRIHVAAALERAVVGVRDHGIGIPAEDVHRIFDRFERAVPLTHFGGFGIGLWVARQTVEALGGTIRVSSEPGQGSTFTVELPLVP